MDDFLTRHRGWIADTSYLPDGLGRNKIRDLAFKGDIPGIVKASW